MSTLQLQVVLVQALTDCTRHVELCSRLQVRRFAATAAEAGVLTEFPVLDDFVGFVEEIGEFFSRLIVPLFRLRGEGEVGPVTPQGFVRELSMLIRRGRVVGQRWTVRRWWG